MRREPHPSPTLSEAGTIRSLPFIFDKPVPNVLVKPKAALQTRPRRQIVASFLHGSAETSEGNNYVDRLTNAGRWR